MPTEAVAAICRLLHLWSSYNVPVRPLCTPSLCPVQTRRLAMIIAFITGSRGWGRMSFIFLSGKLNSFVVEETSATLLKTVPSAMFSLKGVHFELPGIKTRTLSLVHHSGNCRSLAFLTIYSQTWFAIWEREGFFLREEPQQMSSCLGSVSIEKCDYCSLVQSRILSSCPSGLWSRYFLLSRNTTSGEPGSKCSTRSLQGAFQLQPDFSFKMISWVFLLYQLARSAESLIGL